MSGVDLAGVLAPLVATLVRAPEVAAALREAVRAEIGAWPPTATPPVARVTLDELARLEACSRATVRRLVAEGAPVTYVGQSPRFDVEAFRAWLDARGRKGTRTPEKPVSGPIPGVRLLSRGAK